MNYKNCGDNLPELVPTFHIGIDGISPEAKFLGDFKKKVAKDLRDMYARNKRMKDARNLEERCQLLGLGFEPLPKQPGE